MAITYGSGAALQDQIAINVTGVAYSSLTALEKTRLDGTYSGSLTNGAAKEALDEVELWAQWLNMAGAASAPDKWVTWFIALASYKFALLCRPDRAEMLLKAAKDAQRTCLTSFSRKLITYDPGTGADTEAFDLTYQSVRYHVVNHVARLDPPLMVPIESIDSATHSVQKELWCGYKWSFRKRFITLTITAAAPTVPTNDLSSPETFQQSATRRWYYSDAESAGSRWIEQLDADRFAQMRARYGSETGRPAFCHVTQSGDTKVWNFVPLPDDTYTATGFCYIAPAANPVTASGAGDTVPFAKFPSVFRPLIRELVLAYVLKEFNRDPTGERWDKTIDRVSALASEYEDQGEMDDEGIVRDVYGDAVGINGYNSVGGSL